MKHLIKLVILVGLLVNIEKSYGANQRLGEDAMHCASVLRVGFTIGEYCDAPTLLNLAQVNSKVSYEPSRQLKELREWEDNGGLLIAFFGTPSEQDLENLRKLPQWDEGLGHTVSANQIKNLLLSYVHIPDQLVVKEVSDRVEAFIDTLLTISSRQKYQLKQLLPNSHNYELGQLLTDYNYDWLDGESLDVSIKDKEKILAQLLKRPTELSDRPNEVSSVLQYLFKTPNVQVKHCKAFIRLWFESSDLTLSDLCLIQVYSNFFGYYREAEFALERMIDHPEMKRWMKWYITIVAKPYINYVLLPLSRTYKTVSVLGGMLVGEAKKRFGVQ